MNAPQDVYDLGTARQTARSLKNFALADQLRDQIAGMGWEILDLPGGFEFRPTARFQVVPRITDVKPLTNQRFDVTVAIIVDGFCSDAVVAIQSIKAFSKPGTAIAVLISGTPDLENLVDEIDGQTFLVQVSEGAGWGESANMLLKIATSPIVVVMDPSTRFTGDALSPVLAKFSEGSWHAVGWRGGLVDLDDDWRSTQDRGEGEVDVLFSYFLALDRDAAIESGAFNIRAIYYRNADIEFSLRLRQGHGKLWQLELPLIQARHHGYYDTDPEFRDIQSRKNYDRILDRFRGKVEILSPRR